MQSYYKTFREIADTLADAADNTDLGVKSLTRVFTRRLSKKTQAVRDTYQACLGRLPEANFSTGSYPSTKAAATHIVQSLVCAEFIRNVPHIVANAFPDAPRIFFVHIPKTGGSDVKTRLRSSGNFVWDPLYEDPAWLSEDGGVPFLLKMIARQARHPDRPIVLAGHQTVDWFKAAKLIRASDRVFTVLRDPDSIAISWINYTMMAVLDAADRVDGRQYRAWMAEMGLVPPRNAADVTPAMIGTLLQHPRIISDRADIITRYLSSDGTVTSAVDNIRYLNMDVVDITALDRYIADDLSLPATDGRTNVSRRFIESLHELSWRQRLDIRTSTGTRDALTYTALRDLMGEDGVLRPMRDLPQAAIFG